MGDSVSGQIGECGRGVSADSICQHRSCGENLGNGWPGQLILQSNRFEIRNVLKNAHLNARSAQHCQHCPCAEELGSRWKGQLILQSNCGGNMFQKMYRVFFLLVCPINKVPDPKEILTLRIFLKGFTCNLTLSHFLGQTSKKKHPVWGIGDIRPNLHFLINHKKAKT